MQKENKTLSANNSSLQKENRQLKDKISKIDGCDWSGMTETRIMTHRAWTNDFATNEANFEQSNIDTFLSAVDKMSYSAENYVSLMDSNGCADQLTNWDGSKKPGLAAPEKKKGGGMSRLFFTNASENSSLFINLVFPVEYNPNNTMKSG